MPIAGKIVLNMIFFILYTLIGMNLVNFIYDLILNFTGHIVPVADDLIHYKIAGIIFLLILIFTILFRKFFYFSFEKKENKNKKENNDDKEDKYSYTKTKKEVEENIEKEIEKTIEESEKPKLEIYIDKEIK